MLAHIYAGSYFFWFYLGLNVFAMYIVSVVVGQTIEPRTLKSIALVVGDGSLAL